MWACCLLKHTTTPKKKGRVKFTGSSWTTTSCWQRWALIAAPWTLARVLSDPVRLSISLHNQRLQTPADLECTAREPKSAELRVFTPHGALIRGGVGARSPLHGKSALCIFCKPRQRFLVWFRRIYAALWSRQEMQADVNALRCHVTFMRVPLTVKSTLTVPVFHIVNWIKYSQSFGIWLWIYTILHVICQTTAFLFLYLHLWEPYIQWLHRIKNFTCNTIHSTLDLMMNILMPLLLFKFETFTYNGMLRLKYFFFYLNKCFNRLFIHW